MSRDTDPTVPAAAPAAAHMPVPTAARTLPVQAGTALEDPAVAALLAQRDERQYRQGHADGFRAGVAAADDAARQLCAQVEALTGRFEQHQADTSDALIQLAVDLAETFLGCALPADAAGVAQQVRNLLQQIDDPAVTVLVHPEQADTVGALLAGMPARVVADARVAAGQAQLTGRWIDAAVTADTYVEAVRRAVSELAAPGGAPDDAAAATDERGPRRQCEGQQETLS